jgi:hypothetical protein
MENSRTGHRRPTFLIGLAVYGFAAALAAGIVGGLQVWPSHGRSGLALPPVAVLVLAAVLGIIWQSRARGTRRWRAALDAYAEREMAKERRRERVRTTAYADL